MPENSLAKWEKLFSWESFFCGGKNIGEYDVKPVRPLLGLRWLLNNMKITMIALVAGAFALPLGAETKGSAWSNFALGETKSSAWEHIAPGAG